MRQQFVLNVSALTVLLMNIDCHFHVGCLVLRHLDWWSLRMCLHLCQGIRLFFFFLLLLWKKKKAFISNNFLWQSRLIIHSINIILCSGDFFYFMWIKKYIASLFCGTCKVVLWVTTKTTKLSLNHFCPFICD